MAIRWAAGHETYTTYPEGYGKPPVNVARPTYEGAVLVAGLTRSVQVMSDVWEMETYALVWDGSAVISASVEGSAAVDATPEVLAAARAWSVLKAGEDWLSGWHRIQNAKIAAATALVPGREVVVARGRKVPKGTTGVVIWTGENQWGPRVGIKDVAGATHWTAASNVEVVNPDDYMEVPNGLPAAEEIAAQGEARIAAIEASQTSYQPSYASWISPLRRAA